MQYRCTWALTHFEPGSHGTHMLWPTAISSSGSVSDPLVPFAPTPEGFTDMQSRFCDAFISLGGDGTKAAIIAGYAQGGAANIAMRNLASPKINDEIIRRLKLSGSSALAVAIGGLLRIIERSKDDKAVVAASLGLMDRFGMAPPKGAGVVVNVNNMTGDGVQALINEVWAERERRMKQANEPDLSAIPLAMADNTQLIEHQPERVPIARGSSAIFDP
jgi:hypothetical protein